MFRLFPRYICIYAYDSTEGKESSLLIAWFYRKLCIHRFICIYVYFHRGLNIPETNVLNEGEKVGRYANTTENYLTYHQVYHLAKSEESTADTNEHNCQRRQPTSPWCTMPTELLKITKRWMQMAISNFIHNRRNHYMSLAVWGKTLKRQSFGQKCKMLLL